MEALGLGLFMISAAAFATLLFHRDSPVSAALDAPLLRRALIGLAMGLTAVANIYSPWGRRSGAHLNPATTLTFWSLGRIAGRDVVGYIAAQFVGALFGIGAAALMLGDRLVEPPISAAATAPGPAGPAVAFLAEFAMTFVLISVVLRVSAVPRLVPFTGVIVGLAVAAFITFEDPLSGMSLNPARTLASALAGDKWTALWVYFTAPPLGMLVAAWLFARRHPAGGCAKLNPDHTVRCIFCSFQKSRANQASSDGLL
jgi:aquaporin Z